MLTYKLLGKSSKKACFSIYNIDKTNFIVEMQKDRLYVIFSQNLKSQ